MTQSHVIGQVDTDTNQGEPFSETKQRLSDFTKIKGKQFDKIKFALVAPNSKPEYIEDGKS
jgi:ubiquitin carboxyl-terminal hydrolase 7